MSPYVQVIVPALVALVVVALSHASTRYRDRENERREQRIGYLVNGFRALAKIAHHPSIYEVAGEVEQAVVDIQLFGTPEQVNLIQRFALELAANKSANLDSLMSELRDTLRKELGAKPISGRLVWLRIAKNQDSLELS